MGHRNKLIAVASAAITALPLCWSAAQVLPFCGRVPAVIQVQAHSAGFRCPQRCALTTGLGFCPSAVLSVLLSILLFACMPGLGCARYPVSDTRLSPMWSPCACLADRGAPHRGACAERQAEQPLRGCAGAGRAGDLSCQRGASNLRLPPAGTSCSFKIAAAEAGPHLQ